MNKKNSAVMFSAVIVLLLGMFTPAGEKIELHGSCVYAIQSWHNPLYVKYCVPLPYADEAWQVTVPLTIITAPEPAPSRTITSKAATDSKQLPVVVPPKDKPRVEKPVVVETPVCVQVSEYHPCP